jgi:hypothetical protein
VGLPRFGRWTAYVLVGINGVITLATVVGLVRSVTAVREPGLSAAQKQSVLASGIAEATYNGAFGVLLVAISAIWRGRSEESATTCVPVAPRLPCVACVWRRSGAAPLTLSAPPGGRQ